MKRYPIPKTRDPFINAPLIHAGFDPETGLERFWCSTWNDNVGAIGALIRSDGEARIYRFEKDRRIRGMKCGFYAAVPADNDTLWLCGNTAMLHRLTLSTGEMKEYPTGVAPSLMGRGIFYDAPSGKVCFGTATVKVLDVASGEMHTVFEESDGWMDAGFANADGTYTLNFVNVHKKTSTLRRWDPKTDAVEEIAFAPICNYMNGIPRFGGRRYVGGLGWTDSHGRVADGPIPKDGIDWADTDGRFSIGSDWAPASGRDDSRIYRWEPESGEIKVLGEVEDTPRYSVALTKDGGAAALSVYGRFVRFDEDGSRAVDVMLDTDSVILCDCVLRADEHTILGTPFITQCFWTIDEATGEGCDRGRATAGVGEVMRTWKLGGKVYMASYTEGQIAEFDPQKGGRFPDNPRPVVRPKHSMRPMGAAQSDTVIYSASNHHYGEHGFELVSYNTVTGEVKEHDDPIPHQQAVSLYYNETHHLLIGATDSRSDCEKAPRVYDHAVVALFDAETLDVVGVFDGPKGEACLVILGPKDEDSYYVAAADCGWDGPITKVGVFDLRERSLSLSGVDRFPDYDHIRYAGDPDTFVVREGERLYLSKGGFFDRTDLLMEVPGMVRFWCSDGEVFAVTEREIFTEKIS